MIFNTALAESAGYYDAIQEAKKIESIDDAKRELNKIKAGKHENPMKWMKYLLSVALPWALGLASTAIPFVGIFTLVGGLGIALSNYLKGMPGSTADKYRDMVKLRPEVDKAIKKIKNSNKYSEEEKQKLISELNNFKEILDKNIREYKKKKDELGMEGSFR